MANYKQVSYGSKGNDVTELQKLLNNNGYSLDTDGVFGPKTQAAVKDYQKKTGLSVDGVVGKNTWGALTKAQSASTDSNNTKKITTPSGFTYDAFTYDPFKESDTVNQAWAALGQLQGNAPGDWVDPYKDKHTGYLDQYENRDPFSYNVNNDALYQQYKDQYIQQGNLAMMDAMGQAAAMGGGYGNSYAQTAGQQVYNQYLGQLNAIVPELYSMAYDRHQQEGQDLLNLHSLYRGLSDQDYSQYLGSVDKYFKELAAASDYANTLYNKEYGEWSDKTKMDYDLWSTNTNIQNSDYQMLKNQQFQASENAKSRNVRSSPQYADFGFEEQEKWAKKFADALATGKFENIEAVADNMTYANIDPNIVGKWFDQYAIELEKKLAATGAKAPHQSGSLGRYTH